MGLLYRFSPGITWWKNSTMPPKHIVPQTHQHLQKDMELKSQQTWKEGKFTRFTLALHAFLSMGNACTTHSIRKYTNRIWLPKHATWTWRILELVRLPAYSVISIYVKREEQRPRIHRADFHGFEESHHCFVIEILFEVLDGDFSSTIFILSMQHSMPHITAAAKSAISHEPIPSMSSWGKHKKKRQEGHKSKRKYTQVLTSQ